MCMQHTLLCTLSLYERIWKSHRNYCVKKMVESLGRSVNMVIGCGLDIHGTILRRSGTFISATTYKQALVLLNNLVRSCKYTHNYSTAALCADICEVPGGFQGVKIEVKLDKYCSYLLVEFFKNYFYSLDLNIPWFGTCRKITGCHCNCLDE